MEQKRISPNKPYKEVRTIASICILVYNSQVRSALSIFNVIVNMDISEMNC